MLIHSMSVSVDRFSFHLALVGELGGYLLGRTLDSVQGNARLAEGSVAEQVAAALDATDEDARSAAAAAWLAKIERDVTTC
jgi:hypothetical protein